MSGADRLGPIGRNLEESTKAELIDVARAYTRPHDGAAHREAGLHRDRRPELIARLQGLAVSLADRLGPIGRNLVWDALALLIVALGWVLADRALQPPAHPVHHPARTDVLPCGGGHYDAKPWTAFEARRAAAQLGYPGAIVTRPTRCHH